MLAQCLERNEGVSGEGGPEQCGHKRAETISTLWGAVTLLAEGEVRPQPLRRRGMESPDILSRVARAHP